MDAMSGHLFFSYNPNKKKKHKKTRVPRAAHTDFGMGGDKAPMRGGLACDREDHIFKKCFIIISTPLISLQ